VATRYNSHSGISFQNLEPSIPIILLEGVAILIQIWVNFELSFPPLTYCTIPPRLLPVFKIVS